MFIQFIFNENTNIVKTLLAAGTASAAAPSSTTSTNTTTGNTLSTRTATSKSSTFTDKVHSFASRVCPPLLGKYLGLFATRSPHRPNALGLSLCRIEAVDVDARRVYVSGADLVDGSLVVGMLFCFAHREMHVFLTFL